MASTYYLSGIRTELLVQKHSLMVSFLQLRQASTVRWRCDPQAVRDIDLAAGVTAVTKMISKPLGQTLWSLPKGNIEVGKKALEGVFPKKTPRF